MMVNRLNLAALVTAALIVGPFLGVAGEGIALAQTMNANAGAYNAGYGRYADEENQPTSYSIRDANGNLVILDGIIQTGVDESTFGFATGAGQTFAGVGAVGGVATAIGNSLNVVTEGDNNTVIVNSVQTNTGDVSASAH